MALNAVVRASVTALCADLATPRALTVAKLIENEEWDQLARLEVDPRDYTSADRYRRDASAVGLLRKYGDLETTIDRKAVAVENFYSAEAQCHLTNRRLDYLLPGSPYCEWGESLRFLVDLVRKEVCYLIGYSPDPPETEGKFGPGTTFGDRGFLSTIADKMTSDPTVTSGSILFDYGWSANAWGRARCAHSPENHVRLIRGNRFLTVPKDATKDRGICVEPSINVFYQLPLGSQLRERLRRRGLDLVNAQSLHKRVACAASLSGEFATIDLTNASDTVAYGLVKAVLPPAWFDRLDQLRSPFTQIEGRWVKLEKFSSMGNGYTFELETLLFNAITRVCCRLGGVEPINGVNVFTFGDDIICPTEVSNVVLAALRLLGFTPNPKKTFTSGPFRESCGGDYFLGQDVRPFFLRSDPDEPSKLISFANGLRRLSQICFSNQERRHPLRAWFCVLDALPRTVRDCRGPDHLGDIVVHDDESRWQLRWKDSIRYFKCYTPIPGWVSWRHFRPDVVLACALYGTGHGAWGISPRDSVVGYRFRWVPYS